MSFVSPVYPLFLLGLTLLIWRLPAGARPWTALAASYVFYMGWEPRMGLLLFGVTALSYAGGRLAAGLSSRRARRWALGLTLGALGGLLAFFKYARFLLESALTLARLFGAETPDVALSILLPVGVSFYLFQALSFVLEAYWGRLEAMPAFRDYALYLSFFPQLVAGPIERPQALLPQLAHLGRPGEEELRRGVRLILSGYFRKVVAADAAGAYVDRIFADPAGADGFAVLLGAGLFAVQIYCDFSGYSEIAAGSAQLLNVRLMRNFRQPYAARSLRDFWRRWHISLSSWFSDYVYIPLGGSRRGRRRQVWATLAVFALSGLWHGANWTFVVWGLLHGLLLCAETVSGKSLGRVGVLASVGLGWIFFRAASVPQALELLSRLFTRWDWAGAMALLEPRGADVLRLGLAAAILPLLEGYAYPPQGEKTPFRPVTAAFFVLCIALFYLRSAAQSGVNGFIYFQF